MAAGTGTNLRHAGKRQTHRGAVVAGIAAAVLIGGTAIFAGGQIYRNYQHQRQVSAALDVQTFYPGIAVNGVSLGGKTMKEAQSAVKAAEKNPQGSYDVKISSGGRQWRLTQKDLTFHYNTDQVLQKAYAYARSGDRETRFRQVQALKTSPKNFAVTQSIDDGSLKGTLQKIADAVDRAAVGPTVTSFDQSSRTFRFQDGKNGVKTDFDKFYSEVVGILNESGKGSVTVPTAGVPFTGSVSELRSHMKKLGSYSTVSRNSAAGTHNMALALATVNGAKIKPGSTFSFLGTVGPADAAQGYQKAGAILNGKLIDEDGGGICQASTTLYGAAARSNMEITGRSNHSIPSSYCPIGQDAAVSYPYLDFKFKNTTGYPIFIVAGASGRVMTATFYGYQSSDYDDIEVTSRVTATYPAPSGKKYVDDSSLPQGAVEQVSRARGGYRAVTVRTFYKNGKAVKTENLPSSYYPPQEAVYSRGTGSGSHSSSGAGSSSSGGHSAANDDVTTAGKPAA